MIALETRVKVLFLKELPNDEHVLIYLKLTCHKLTNKHNAVDIDGIISNSESLLNENLDDAVTDG